MKMWYKNEATTWTESLPLGNGRMGAMVYGKIVYERISLNEDSLWSGYPKDKMVAEPFEHLEVVRKMVRDQAFFEADTYVEQHLLGDYSEAYLPFGDLLLEFQNIDTPSITDYERSLDLESAISSVSFTCDGIAYVREMFISAVDQVLVVHLSASKRGGLSLAVKMTSPLNHQVTIQNEQLRFQGIAPSEALPSYFPCEQPIVYETEDSKKGMTFGATVTVDLTDGEVVSTEDGLLIREASDVVLKIFMRTSYNGFNRQPYQEGKDVNADLKADQQKIQGKSYEDIKADHVTDHQALYNRVALSFGKPDQDLPTDERLIAFQKNQNDPYLYSLLFNYGRYLLIASSRRGTLPANLQGIWNHELRAPFSCNYTTNINVQMNYWPAESSNLSELHWPLFELIKVLSETGQEVAKLYYHAEGAVVHHNSDIWGLATPVGHDLQGMSGCGNWNGGYGWLTQHLMTHYEYTLDLDFLEQWAYPAIKLAADFFMSILEKNEDGVYWAIGTTSPENTYLKDGEKCHISRFPTMTNAIIREVFRNVVKCCDILQIDEQYAATVKGYLEKMYPYQIGAFGQLMEWEADYEEGDVHHRHISHLYGLYPGTEIHPDKTPELAAACAKSLVNRSDVGTGWSLGWKINTWARLGDGDHALKLLKKQLRLSQETKVLVDEGEGSGTYLNLFDAHPPFQIDGNFAAVSGITEMLLQCYDETILLLPALPKELPNGYVKGLRAKNGIEVDINFENGQLVEAMIKSCAPQRRTLSFQYEGRKRNLLIEGDQVMVLTKQMLMES